MKSLLFIVATVMSLPVFSQINPNRVNAIISKMTLEEKADLVVGVGMRMQGLNSNPDVPKEKVPGAAGNTFAIPRLGIPSIVLSDGPAGVRINPIRNHDSSKTYYATSWPVGTLLASSWDTGLVKKVGIAFGNEIHEYGIDVILAPGQDIQRNPLNGRNFEYYSEDPLLSGTISAAMVNGIQSNGVGTSIKHFAANNQETNRMTINENISERALREIYLKNFEITIRNSHPWTVMSSYNKINGIYTSESYDLLTTLLRKEWNYKGLVMSDWFGGTNTIAQMEAHNNLLMPGTPAQKDSIIKAVKDGNLDEKILDENVARVLDLIFKSPTFKKYKYNNSPDFKKDAEISRNAAEEGMVLLKNLHHALPLQKGHLNIALFGINGYQLIQGGTGSGQVNTAYTIPLSTGLGNAGFLINPLLEKAYSDYLKTEKAKRPKKSIIEEFRNPTPPIGELSIDNSLLMKTVGSSDLAIISIGRNSGEGNDRKIKNDFDLSQAEDSLISEVSNLYHSKQKKVIVVLNIAGPIEVASWKDEADAILCAWQPGLEGGNAIAAVLDGKVNPSGKLAQTFPMVYKDVPSSQTFPGKEFPEEAKINSFGMKMMPAEINYDDGIYVGYRYYTSYNIKPAYAFGYGLSYTSFSYSNLKLNSHIFDKKIVVSCTISNKGKVPGKEVVQLYISAPAKQINKPVEELKAFAKTRLLQSGQSQVIRFVLSPSDLASFYPDQSAWIAEKGNYEVKIASSSDDIRERSEFVLPKDIVVERVHKILPPQVHINEMKGEKN